MTDHASLRAALAGGAEFDDMTIITVRMGDLRALLADYDRMRDALNKLRRGSVSGVRRTRTGGVMTESERLLQSLVAALDAAFISSWQSTAYWQGELDDAREYLNRRAQEQGGSDA